MKIDYTDPVKFTKTNNYGSGPEDEDDVYTVAEWIDHCKGGSFIDYDGYGYRVKDGKQGGPAVHPSMVTSGTFEPYDATHIVWFNK